MAKKYQAIESKVHPMTWVIMGLVVVSLLIIFFAVQPTEKDVFYDSYESTMLGNTEFGKRLPKDNKVHLLKSLDNEWFNEGLYSLADRDDQITIVYFGNPTLTDSAMKLANSYAYLFGAPKVEVDPAAVYTELGDTVKFYYFEVNQDQMTEFSEAFAEKYDIEFTTATLPYIMAFYDGEVLIHDALTQANVTTYLKVTFYKGIFQHEAISHLLD